MLVVISYPIAVADEAAIINSLFDEGLEVLHIRKPAFSVDEMRSLIEKIKPQYYHQVALHQHHEMAGYFDISRLHYTEISRKKTKNEELTKLKESRNILSTSIHRVEEYNRLSDCFDYTFFGPVFNSISKPGYASALSPDFAFPDHTGRPKPIAIGGIDTTNIQKAKRMNFSGVAALGAIWEKPEEGVMQFKKLQQVWNQTGR